jgi:hypothetical protein
MWWRCGEAVRGGEGTEVPSEEAGPEVGSYSTLQKTLPMDQIFTKTPNPKCRLYWCLIEFTDWRYSQSTLEFSTGFVKHCLSNSLPG